MSLAELVLSVCLALGNEVNTCEQIPEPIVQVGPYAEFNGWLGVFTDLYPE